MSKKEVTGNNSQKKNESIENKPVEGRRNLVKKLAAGGAIAAAVPVIPKQWAKPVTDAVLLPAHAQTSTVPPPGGLPITVSIGLGNVDGAGNGIPGTITTPGVTNFPNENIDTIEIINVSATVSPAAATNITMNVTAPYDFTGGGTNQVVATNPGTGVANFAAMSNASDHDYSNPSTLVITFDAPGYAQSSFTFNMSNP